MFNKYCWVSDSPALRNKTLVVFEGVLFRVILDVMVVVLD